jgi:hypothetical protein
MLLCGRLTSIRHIVSAGPWIFHPNLMCSIPPFRIPSSVIISTWVVGMSELLP